MSEKKPFLLRISPELYDALAAWASDELRSLNGQIEFLLRKALAEGGRKPGASKPRGSEASGLGTGSEDAGTVEGADI